MTGAITISASVTFLEAQVSAGRQLFYGDHCPSQVYWAEYAYMDDDRHIGNAGDFFAQQGVAFDGDGDPIGEYPRGDSILHASFPLCGECIDDVC